MARAGKPTHERSNRLQLFDGLYQAYAAAVYDYLLGRTTDPEVARDLMQEACIRLWRAIPELRDLAPARQRAWLFTVARHLVVDFYRSRASAAASREMLRQQAFATEPAVSPAAEADVIWRNDLDVLDAAIGRLPEDLRIVLALQVLGDRTSSEIGELLGRPAGTVRYQLARARRQLADELRLVRAEEEEEVPS
jgi:RNA polymerase sigma-70 factor (ECF subfamily)